MKLSIVIPAHNEAGSIGSTLADIAERLDAEGIDYEIVAVDDASSDGTGAVDPGGRLRRTPAIRYHRSHNPPGFGFAVRAGLDVYEGDAAAIVMADGSDSPEDIATYYRVLSEGYDCAFGSRFVRGSRVIDYPKPKLALNRWSTSSSGCSSGTATTTRRTPSRRTAARRSTRVVLSSRTTST